MPTTGGGPILSRLKACFGSLSSSLSSILANSICPTGKSKLEDVHQTAWVKWDLARDMWPLPPDAEEQTPGEVDESIFQDLASVMNALPAPKKYDRAS